MMCVVVAGCTTRGSMMVEVRDRLTGQPVADALVRIDGLGFFLPIWPHWQLSPGENVRGVTSAEGIASFNRMTFPAAVYVISGRHLPLRLEVRDPVPPGSWTQWMHDSEFREIDGATLEARIGP